MDEITLDNLMQEYEGIAQTNLIYALKKMVDLYLGKFNLSHETANSIELWIFEKSNYEIINYIKSFNNNSRLLDIANEGLKK